MVATWVGRSAGGVLLAALLAACGERGGEAAGTSAAPGRPAGGAQEAAEAGASADGGLPEGAPRLHVLEAPEGRFVHDFGEVEVGRTFQAVFSFVWTGEQPLEPEKLRPNCGCLSAALFGFAGVGETRPLAMGTPIRAGRPFAVRVDFTPPRSAEGPLEKEVFLTFREPVGVLRLVVAANVRRPS